MLPVNTGFFLRREDINETRARLQLKNILKYILDELTRFLHNISCAQEIQPDENS